MLLLDKETEDVILPFVAKKDKETSTLNQPAMATPSLISLLFKVIYSKDAEDLWSYSRIPSFLELDLRSLSI